MNFCTDWRFAELFFENLKKCGFREVLFPLIHAEFEITLLI